MSDRDASETAKPRRGVVIFLSLLPLWLIVSTGIGLWLWNRGGEGDPGQPAFRTPISTEGLGSDLRKIVEIAGPRHTGSERGRVGLKRVAAMIQGSLGPENSGYALEIVPGPGVAEASWPLVLARLPGEGKGLVVVAGYDASPGGPGVETNGTGLASVLALAQAMAGEDLGKGLTFVFVPHAYDRDAPRVPTAQALLDAVGEVEALLVVEATGASDDLIVSAWDAALLAPMEGMARVVEAQISHQDGVGDPSSLLSDLGAPVVRVSTRVVVPAEKKDDMLPDPVVHAAATARLADLVRKLAALH